MDAEEIHSFLRFTERYDKLQAENKKQAIEIETLKQSCKAHQEYARQRLDRLKEFEVENKALEHRIKELEMENAIKKKAGEELGEVGFQLIAENEKLKSALVDIQLEAGAALATMRNEERPDIQKVLHRLVDIAYQVVKEKKEK